MLRHCFCRWLLGLLDYSACRSSPRKIYSDGQCPTLLGVQCWLELSKATFLRPKFDPRSIPGRHLFDPKLTPSRPQNDPTPVRPKSHPKSLVSYCALNTGEVLLYCALCMLGWPILSCRSTHFFGKACALRSCGTWPPIVPKPSHARSRNAQPTAFPRLRSAASGIGSWPPAMPSCAGVSQVDGHRHTYHGAVHCAPIR